MKIRGGLGSQGRRGGKLGFLVLDVVVVSAQREFPDLVRGGPSACIGKIRPGDSSFNAPSPVGVITLVQGSVQDHPAFHMKAVFLFQRIKIGHALFGKEAVKHRVGRIHLKFVIPGMIFRGFQEDFKDIVVPGISIMFLNVRKKVGIFHLGKEIKIIPVPGKSGFGWCLGRAILLAQPGHVKISDWAGIFPAFVIHLAIDDRSGNSPTAPGFCAFRWQYQST